MTQTITIRYRLYVDDPTPLIEVSEAYRDACNHVSEYMFGRGMDDVPSFRELHDSLYHQIRSLYGLKAQMAQSAMRTVQARYSTLITQIRDTTKAAEAWDKRKSELEAKGRKPNTKRPKVTAWTLIRFRALHPGQVSGRWGETQGAQSTAPRCDVTRRSFRTDGM